MKKIYKYELRVTSTQFVALPKGFQILSVGVQFGKLQLWVMVDPEERNIKDVLFEIYGTGHPIHTREEYLFYIGTVQEMDGSLVWHVFQNIVV